MNVYDVTVSFKEENEALVTLSANSPDEAEANLKSFLSQQGFIDIVVSSIIDLGSAANYIHPDSEVLN